MSMTDPLEDFNREIQHFDNRIKELVKQIGEHDKAIERETLKKADLQRQILDLEKQKSNEVLKRNQKERELLQARTTQH